MKARLEKKLQTEVIELERELRIEIPRQIKVAVAHGDLKENAEYHAALERQNYVRARIGQIRKRLSDLSLINWGEVYCGTSRAAGPEAAERVAREIDTLPIEIVPVDRDLTRRAAELKAAHRLSYADCFAAALAQTRRGELVTGDQEFAPLKNRIKIVWIG